jgi:lysophospholipase L1-like esterase
MGSTSRVRRLLGVGDSIIAGVGAAEQSEALVARSASHLASRLGESVAWTATGRSGADARRAVERLLPRLPAEPADFVLVSVGVNDCTGLSRLSDWQAQLRKLLAGLRDHSPEATILFLGLPPIKGFPVLPWPLRPVLGARAERLDAVLADTVMAGPGVRHLPLDFETTPERFSADGYHPNASSYDELAQAVAEKMLIE